MNKREAKSADKAKTPTKPAKADATKKVVKASKVTLAKPVNHVVATANRKKTAEKSKSVDSVKKTRAPAKTPASGKSASASAKTVPKKETRAATKPVSDKVKARDSGQMRPKNPLSGYMYFTIEMGAKLRSHADIKMSEAMKQCGALWKDMNEKQRAPYEAKHKEDQKRFDSQMKELTEKGYFVMPDGKKSSAVRAPTKDDSRPKKSCHAYMYFVSANVSKLMAEHKCPMTEASKKASIAWNAMTEAAQKPYLDKASDDKKRHDKEMAEFKSKGYFTMPDGTKSFEHKKKSKRTSAKEDKKLLAKRSGTATARSVKTPREEAKVATSKKPATAIATKKIALKPKKSLEEAKKQLARKI